MRPKKQLYYQRNTQHSKQCKATNLQIYTFQVAVPSRTDVLEYKDLKETIDKMVGAINGKYSTPAWSPIRYIFGSIGQNDLVAFYRDADVALVTPLRDGMNLVCKEFVV